MTRFPEEKRFMVDLHIHSCFSPDSPVTPRIAIKTALNMGLSAIAITDHDTIRGGLETSKINTDPNFLVIVGSEIETDWGDVIGLFLTKEIESRSANDVINEIQEQNGLALWAHPFREGKKQLPAKLICKVDIIEGYNAKTAAFRNTRAVTLATKYQKPIIGVSDAHNASDIGSIATMFNGSVHDVRSTLIMGNRCILGSEISLKSSCKGVPLVQQAA